MERVLHLLRLPCHRVFYAHAHDEAGDILLRGMRMVGLFDATLYEGQTLMDFDDLPRFEKIAREMGFELAYGVCDAE